MTEKALQDAMLGVAQTITIERQGAELIWYEEIVLPTTSNYIIRGVINRDTLALIIGETGAGKTFAALDMALSVATGKAWRGCKTRQGLVLYLAAEAGASIMKRVIAWRRHNQVDEAAFAVRILPLDLLHPTTPQNLLDLCETAAVKRGPILMIVIDTVSRSMPGSEENSSEIMTQYVRVCDRIRAETGAAVVLVHHKGKEASKGARGHSSLKAAADTEIDVSSEGEGKIAKVTKQRDDESGNEYRFALRRINLGVNEEGDAITSCVVVDLDAVDPPDPEAHLTDRQRAALGAIREFVPKFGSDRYRGATAGKPGVTSDKVVDHIASLMTGISQRSRQREAARRTIEALSRQGLIIAGKTRVSLP